MNINGLNVLVVDDNREMGLLVVEALWKGGFPVQYFQFDAAELHRIRKVIPSHSTRVVFMDINLIGGAIGNGHASFGAIETTLKTLLAPNNGPYVLITWSSHDDYADQLFEFLKRRMPPELQPILTKRLSKEDYNTKRKAARLPRTISQYLSELGSASCLISWESAIRAAAASTLNTLGGLAASLPDHADHADKNQKLGAVIRTLAAAEAADHLDHETAFPALSSVLGTILSDESASTSPVATKKHGGDIVAMQTTKAKDWQPRIHRALHVEYGGTAKRMHAPGDTFVYPAKTKRNRAGLPVLDADQLLKSQFLNYRELEKIDTEEQSLLLKKIRMLIVELTPPCDHAQKKLLWHRYVLAAELPGEIQAKFVKNADYLLRLPAFLSKHEETRFLLLNSRAIVSVQPQHAMDLGPRQYRLRAPIFADIIRWVSSQQARLGYVSVG